MSAVGKTRPLPGVAFNVIVQCVSHQFSFARPNEGKKKRPGQRMEITQSIKPTALEQY